MVNSPLTDAKRFTLNVEKAYREMWQTWCNVQACPVKKINHD